MKFLRDDRIRRGLRSPLAWILAACAAVRVVGLGWGLPASDGWDNDGIAPRDLLVGLIETLTPGHFFTYPPIHLLLLGVLTAPITAIALLRAPSLGQEDVVAEILKVPYMTSMAYVARATSLVMSLGITYAVARIAEAVGGRRAGYLAASFVGFDMSLTYYAHTSNLDVPYLFWAMFSLLALVRAISENEPRRLCAFAICVVMAVASKDQAYALFALTVPLALIAWMAFDPEARPQWRSVARSFGLASALGAALFLVADAVVLNPSGFRQRLRFLVGPASQDFAQYSATWIGRLRVIRDVFVHYVQNTPIILVLLVGLGLVLQIGWGRRRQGGVAAWCAGLVPLFAIVSFTLTFNCIARRVEHRFVLPQIILFGVYGGIAADTLLFALDSRWLRSLSGAIVALGLGQQIFYALALDATLLCDPRYRAERWMQEHVAEGERIETYGLNVYLPRFPRKAHVTRVGPEPTRGRNPMPGIEEVQDSFEGIDGRNPKYIVFTQAWGWRYLEDPLPGDVPGMITPPNHLTTTTDPDGTVFFRALLHDQLNFRLVLHSGFEGGIFPRVDIHGSTGRTIWIFQRDEASALNRP